LTARVMDELIEPLCISALNLPAAQASGAVFLRVLRDALFGPAPTGPGLSMRAPVRASTLLLPRQDLSALLPDAAERWLRERGHTVHLGTRIEAPVRHGNGWRLGDDADRAPFDRVIWATGAAAAAKGLAAVAPNWARVAGALEHTAITTVYAWAP